MLGNSKYVIRITFPRQKKKDTRTRHNTSVNHNPCFLEVSSAFDAAWWPSVLTTLKDFNSPTNIYKLTKSYLSQSTAVMSTNTVKVEREVSNVCPQESCFGNGVWNTQYNSSLTWNSGNKSKH